MRAAPDMQVKCGSYMRVPWSEEISFKVESTQTVKRNMFISGLMSPPSSDGPNNETFQNLRLQSEVLLVWGTKVWWRWWMSTSHSEMVLDPLPHYHTSVFSMRVTLEEHPWLSYSPAFQTDAHYWRSKGYIFHTNSRQVLKRKKKKKDGFSPSLCSPLSVSKQELSRIIIPLKSAGISCAPVDCNRNKSFVHNTYNNCFSCFP